ncbi:MAG: hypothetical protein ACREO1_12725 [Arenimonas sp.]
MSKYTNDFAPFKFWNRFGIAVFVFALPAILLVSFLTEGTSLANIFVPIAFAVFVIAFLISYFRIRAFRCPRCGNNFTLKHVLGTNSAGRKCVHCGLPAHSA